LTELTVPLTLEQEWFFARRITDGGTPILITRALNIAGPLDVDRLLEAFDAVIEQHQGMRTTLGINQRGEPSLVIHSQPADTSLVLQAVTARSRQQFEAYASGAARADIISRWNPVRGPIYRMRLLRRSAEEHILLCTFDHLMFDDRGVELFLHYLWSWYSGEDGSAPDAGNNEAFSDLAASIRAERERYADRAAGINAEYWALLYAQIPENLPPDQTSNRQNEPKYESDYTVIDVDGDSVERIRSAAARAGVSMFAAYVSAFAWTIFDLTKREKLAIYVPLDNRRPADRGVIGNFACVRPVIVRRTGGAVDSYLQQVVGQLFRSLAHRHMDGASENRAETQVTGHPALRALAVNYMRADRAEILVSTRTGLTLQRAYYAPGVPTRLAETMILGVREESRSVRLSLRHSEEFLSAKEARAVLSSCVAQLTRLRPQSYRPRENGRSQ
jgi:hypothetical protein